MGSLSYQITGQKIDLSASDKEIETEFESIVIPFCDKLEEFVRTLGHEVTYNAGIDREGHITVGFDMPW